MYLYLNGFCMKEAENQIRYHRFIDSLVKKNNAKYIEKSDEQMKKQLIESDNESYLIIEIHDIQVLFILLSMGLLLSFTVFFIENIVLRASGQKRASNSDRSGHNLRHIQNKTLFITNRVYGRWVNNT